MPRRENITNPIDPIIESGLFPLLPLVRALFRALYYFLYILDPWAFQSAMSYSHFSIEIKLKFLIPTAAFTKATAIKLSQILGALSSWT